MKRYGHPPTPPDYIVPPGPRYEIDLKFWNLTHANTAHYEVVMKRRDPKGRALGRGFHFEERIEDQDLTLGMLWDPEKERNLSKGRCENTEIGVIYEYDLGGGFSFSYFH